MKKYKKNRVIFEEKVFDRKRKPVYGTRKLSVGLVSCMLGFMMFLPTSKASEEDIISTNQQVEDKNQVLDKTDDFADQEKEEVTPLNDQTDSKVDSEENLSDQNLDGQNREEDIIKEENSDSNLEDKDEELLTADEIQAIRDRANSLENDYFFNDNMVEELKAELRKAKADPSVNYEEAKARLIDEAIQKNAPDKEAPGEERAAVKVRKPTINPVSLESKTITGGNLEGSNKRKKLNKDCIIHVTVKDASGTIIETATTKIPPKGGSEWTVTLTKGLEAGYKVYAKQEFNGEFSDENSYEVKALLKDIHKDDLKMPSGQFWLEQTSSNIINDDEKAEALELLKKANPTIANDIESIDFKIYGIEDNKKASYIITYTDGSKTEEIQAPDLKIVPVTETSRGFTFDKVVVTNKSISGKLKGEGPFDNIKVHIVLNVSDQDTEFCKDGKCTITKNSSDPIEVKVNSDGTFSYDLKEGELSYNQKVGIFVKEIHKFKYCDKTTVMLASPEVTDVKDPRKLTQADKENIDAAIRKANTVGGASKLPEGSGDWDGLPAVIQFDENGNVKIFSGNDVAGTWDPNNDYKFVPETNEDGSYKLNDGAEAKITIPGKDLVKNIKPDAPEIKVNEDDKTKITINAKAVDTDANVITVSYTCSDDSSKTLKATKADDGTWSITEGEGSIDANGVVTLEVSKVKGGTNVTATVTDKGGIADDDKKALTSDQAEFKVTKATLVEALGGLDPVAIKKWVGDTVDWKDGVKAKDSATAENKVKIKEILDEATTKFTDETTPGRNTDARGDFKGTIKVAFDDGSIIEVKNQNLYVSDHVTSIKRDNTPSDALEVEFKLGEGTKVDNTSGGAIEGNKDNPTSYSKYKVKPGTDLKEYKLPSINTSVVDSINVTTQDTYTEPVWKDSKNGTNFVASTENKVFTATATKTYKVTLTANGGKGEDKVEVKKTGEKYKLPEKSTFNPPNKNQEFSGWVIGDGPGINKPGDEITVDGDKVIKAIWKPIEFKVTFQTEKGATGSMDPVTIKKGDEYVIPKPTFKPEEGKEFAGWKIEGQEGLKKAGERIDKISGDVTLIATWKDIMVNVTYNAGDGSGEMKGATIKKGSNYKLSSNEFTAPTNKKFKGWKIGETEYPENAELPIEKDTEVIAIWEDIEYKVTFNGNGGSGDMPEKKAKKGSEFELPNNGFEAPKNKKFSHWKIGNENKNPGEKITIDCDTEITAIWKDIMVNVSYNAGEGSGEMTGATIKQGSTYKLSSNGFTAPTNKKFKGWKVGEKEYAPEEQITVDKDTEVTALWEDIMVNVTYKPGEGSGEMTGATIKQGSTYKLSKNSFTAPANKKFKGWKVGEKEYAPEEQITVDKDTEVTALWEDIMVNVTYKPGEGSGEMTGATIKQGSTYKLSSNGFTAPTNKKFKGWKIGEKEYPENAELPIEKDTEVIAIWEDIEYKVTFNGNGGSGDMPEKKAKKGSEFELPNNGFEAPKNQKFSHWKIGNENKNPGEKITIDGDTEITAIWKDIMVNVSYNAGDGSGEMKGATIKKGSTYKLLANGFTAPKNQEFAGWKIGETEYAPDAEITVNEDTEVKAIWKDIEVKVTYDPNGGSGEMKGAIQKKGTKYNLSPNTFTAPENQEFDTWEVDGQKLAPNAEITLDKDTVVKAIWKDIEYKVNFNGNTGTGSMPEKLIKKGNEYELPANGFTAPENKIFSHWKIGNEDKNPGDKITVNGDTEVIAIWKDVKVKVSYDANGGSGNMDSAELNKGSKYNLLANGFTAPANKEFAGWKIGETEYAPDAEITVNEDTIVTAIWKDKTPETPPVENYTVSFKTETGATGTMPDQTVAKGKYTLPNPTFTAEKGKEFAGWKVGEGTDLKTVGSEIDITGNVTLTAVWKGEVTETVKVSYDANGGSGTMTGAELKKGSTYKLLANSFTAPEGKEFDCWMVGKDKKNPDEEITVEGNVTVVAQWRDKTPETPPVENYTVSFKTETGATGTMPDQTVAKGKYTLPNPTFTAEKGKEFAGWKVGEGTGLKTVGSEIDITGNVTLTAVWKGDEPEAPPATKTFKVSYDANGGSGTMTGAELKKSSTYKLSANSFKAPDKKKFKGWKIGDVEYAAGDEITVDKDTTVTAVWEDIKITPPAKEEVQVSYDPGEGSGRMDVAKLEKGSKYILSANGFEAPDKKKFKGWKIGDKEYAAGAEITIDKDTTVTAIWEDITTDPSTPDPGTNPGEGDNPNNPDQGGDKPNPGTRPGEGDNPEKPGTRPGEGDNPDNPGTRPGEGDNPDKPGENPRPRTKPNGGENISKPKPDEDKITKKPEDNKENSLNNRKVQVTRTKDVKENVQTGVESLGKIGGILSAAIAGLFASKKRKK